jgi:hypothetical protein
MAPASCSTDIAQPWGVRNAGSRSFANMTSLLRPDESLRRVSVPGCVPAGREFSRFLKAALFPGGRRLSAEIGDRIAGRPSPFNAAVTFAGKTASYFSTSSPPVRQPESRKRSAYDDLSDPDVWRCDRYLPKRCSASRCMASTTNVPPGHNATLPPRPSMNNLVNPGA